MEDAGRLPSLFVMLIARRSENSRKGLPWMSLSDTSRKGIWNADIKIFAPGDCSLARDGDNNVLRSFVQE
jgi:hypothetical protein